MRRAAGVLARWLLLAAMAWLLCACGTDEPTVEASADIGVLDTGPEDIALTEDIPLAKDIEDIDQDAQLPWDLGPDFEIEEKSPEVVEKDPRGFNGCPTLGVSPVWKGTFEGIVTYNLESTDPDAPQQGLFFVGGDLGFEIKCLDQKLLVSGTLEGSAEAAGEAGEHPFACNLFGPFDYIDRSIDADIVNGEVRLFKVVSVFFKGNFDGAVQSDGTFTGEWDAVQTSNDLNLEGDAAGSGTWIAYPVPED